MEIILINYIKRFSFAGRIWPRMAVSASKALWIGYVGLEPA